MVSAMPKPFAEQSGPRADILMTSCSAKGKLSSEKPVPGITRLKQPIKILGRTKKASTLIFAGKPRGKPEDTQPIKRGKKKMKTSPEVKSISTSTEPCTTYILYEDKAGGLHMAIYSEDIYLIRLVGVRSLIQPGDVKTCIDEVEDWVNWVNLVPVHLMDDYSNTLKEKASRIAMSSITDDGLAQVIYWDRLGAAGREAFAYLDDAGEREA